MRGAITGKHVVLHSLSIVRHFGVGAYLACLWAAVTRKRTTFLGVLYPAPASALRDPQRWSSR
jgi:hypothetical protein